MDIDEWKNASCPRFEYFEHNFMLFGLTIAPAIFEHLLNDDFQEYLNRFVLIYLDDILIYSKKIKEHEKYMKLVLQKLREKGLNPKE